MYYASNYSNQSKSMKLRIAMIFAMALGLVLLISSVRLPSVSARELQPKGPLVASASDKEYGKVAETLASNVPPLKNSGTSAKTAAALRFACDPRSLGISQYEGGTIAYCKKKNLEVSDTDSAIIEIKPGAARAPHWHDTWEQQILVSGKAKTYLIDDNGQTHEELLTPGMVALLPAGMTHWTETVGDQTAILSLSFPAGFKTFELGDSLIQVMKNNKDCASSGNASCSAKRKSVILILKDGLI
jgi:mannose-6-phosphate isomerase-like protein (cupin superfamily)